MIATVLGACADDGPTGAMLDTFGTRLSPPFLVSNATSPVGTPVSRTDASQWAPATMTWVSLPPGSLPGANAVTLRVSRTGAEAIALVVDGGFDPVSLPAAVGDTIEVSVQGAAAGEPTTYLLAVPASLPPHVVRVDPPPHKRDVPLNYAIVITFSEPMDSASVAGAITLVSGGTPVPGSIVTRSQESGIRAEFVPTAPLAPSRSYELQVGTGAHDRDGEALGSAFQSDFTTTESAASLDPQFYLAVNLTPEMYTHRTVPAGGRIPPVDVTYQGCAVGCDTTYTGYVTIALGAHPTGGTLGGTVTARMVDGVATFADLSADLEGVYSLVATAPGAAPASSSAFQVCAHLCWEWSHAAMPTPRSLPGVGVVGATLYAIGGLDTTGAPSAAVEAYDPSTDTWLPRAPMPTARYGFGIGVVNDIVFVVGGITPSGTTAAVEAYDPATDTWSTRAPLPSPTAFPAAGGVHGTLYVVGGQLPDSTSVATVLAYDPGTDQWSERAPLPAPRSLAGLGVSDGLLYVIGGLTVPPVPYGTDFTVWVYDPTADRWAAKVPTLPPPPWWPGLWYGGPLLPAVDVLPGVGIVVAGGSDGTGSYLTDVYDLGAVYDPVGNRYYGVMEVGSMFAWRVGTSLPSAGVVNGQLYLVGYETYRFIP